MKLLRMHRRNQPDATSSLPAQRRRSRAQAMIEMALIFPILMLLFGILVDGGLALNAWMRVNTAARDATRLVLDAGRNADVILMVQDKLQDLSSDQIDIYVIKGSTDNTGRILDASFPYWQVCHIYGSPTAAASPSCPVADGDNNGSGVQRSDIESKLTYADDTTTNDGVTFAIVEVKLTYSPLLPSLISSGLKIPMNSYAIVQTP